MLRYGFAVWGMMLAWGILLSACVSLPIAGLLATLILLVVLMVDSHRRKWSVLFFSFSLLFFLLLGWLRGHQGDLQLLPSSLHDKAYAVSESVRFRLLDLGLPTESIALLDALLLGRREGLSPELRHLYARVGASHVLALSGLHLSILFGLVNMWMLRVLTHPWLRYALGVLTLLLLWGYALITGFSPSLTRASVMMSILLLSQMRLSGMSGWHTLGLAASCMLFFAPSMLWNIGFQLSFAAVAGILLFYPPLLALLPLPHGLIRWLGQAFGVSLAAQLGTLPLLVYYFHSFSLYSILFSPFYILGVALLLYCSLWVLAFGSSFGFLIVVLVSVLHAFMQFTSALPGAFWEGIFLSESQVILLYLGLLSLLPPLHAVHHVSGYAPGYRRASFFRRWPYLTASILCFLLCYLINP